MPICASLVSGKFSYLANYLGIENVWDGIRVFLDLAIVACIFYYLFRLLKNSRAMQLVKGVIIVVTITILASVINLTTLSYILSIVIEIIPLLLVVIFQPELRRALEGLGNTQINTIFNKSNSKNQAIKEMVEEVIEAAFAMGEERVGALIIFEKETNLTEIAQTGTIVDAKVSAQLLRLLFIPNTPLHDGAVIIREDRVFSAASILPLSDNRKISKDLGTRHRAGIGISERTDCISVIVSEETGAVSIAQNGKITVNVSKNTLKNVLLQNLIKSDKVHQPLSINHKNKKDGGSK